MQMNYKDALMKIKNSPMAQSNPVVKNVYAMLDSGDHEGLINLYRNTCNTKGVEPTLLQNRTY